MSEPALYARAAGGVARLFLARSFGGRGAACSRHCGPVLSRAHRRAAATDRTDDGRQKAGRVEHGQRDIHGEQFRPRRAGQVGRCPASRGRCGSALPGEGDRLDDLEADPELRPRARPQCQRYCRHGAALRVRARRVARHRAPPADPRRRRGAGHGRRPWRARCCRRDIGPARRRDADLPGHGSPDFPIPGAAPCPALSAARARAVGLPRMAAADGCRLQYREPRADEYGPDA